MHDLPEIESTADLTALEALEQARRPTAAAGSGPARVPPGAELTSLLDAVDDLRGELVASGAPTGVTTTDLVTFPYPTAFGLWRAARSPVPLLWLTSRMLVVQWRETDGRQRTLLWCPSDHERWAHTPHHARLRARTPLPTRSLLTVHGTVLGHLRALGIDPADVDYLGFDHLHSQDLRRLIGTRGPSADLDRPQAPVEPWFPNARLLVSRHEWEAVRHLHPLQAPWYQPSTFLDLPPERIHAIDGDVLLGPGVALLACPGHTVGTTSLALHTDEGLWVVSANGIAAESWAPRASRIAGVRSWSVEWGQDVVLNAGTLEFAAWQYNAMMVERRLADPSPEAPFPQCLPSSELVAHRLAPGLAPTHQHRGIEHGRIDGSSALPTTARS